MAASPESLAQVVHRIEELERRVSVLERGPDSNPAAVAASAVANTGLGLPSWPTQSGGVFLVVGIGLLGMAGSYLLRAVAESGAVPNVIAVILATAYAGAWLVAAGRLRGADGFSRTTYASVSALTLAPMLWESTLRFHYLPAQAAAAVLIVFFAGSYVLAWKTRISSVVWISTLATAIASVVLALATRELVMFAAVVLAMALLNEIAVGLGRWGSTRAVAAVAADFLIWGLIFVYRRPAAARLDYPEITTGLVLGSALLLFTIYGASALRRALALQHTITYAEITQLVVTAVLAINAVLHFATPVETIVFAVGCAVVSVVGYAGLFVQFDPVTERRNYIVCATFSLVLMLVGCSLALESGWLPSVLGAAAIMTAVVSAGSSRTVLSFHSVVYLLAAGQSCAALAYAGHTLVGALPQQPQGIVWMMLATALLCYAAGPTYTEDEWRDQVLHVISAALATGTAITVLTAASVYAAGLLVTPAAWHVAVIRMLCGGLVAIAIARLGSWARRSELVWLSYALLALLGVKLVVEDLVLRHAEFIAASIFLYALTLIAVPRLARRSASDAAAVKRADSRIGMSAVQHH